MLYLVLFTLAVLGGIIQLKVSRKTQSLGDVSHLFASWIFGLCVGAGGLLGAYAHLFLARQTALSIGWPPGNPFQTEIAMANLAYGVAGLLCIRQSRGFRWATAVIFSIFSLGAAGVHIHEMVAYQNYAPNNSGALLAMDILIPLTLLALLGVEQTAVPQEERRTSDTDRLAA